jgi:hypothetical protein
MSSATNSDGKPVMPTRRAMLKSAPAATVDYGLGLERLTLPVARHRGGHGGNIVGHLTLALSSATANAS